MSVSVELGDPGDFAGGLYLGSGGGATAAAGGGGGGGGLYLGERQTAQRPQRPDNLAAWGSAVYHYGNSSHYVSVDRGVRWSLVLFFFGSCAQQLSYTESELPASLSQRVKANPQRLVPEPPGRRAKVSENNELCIETDECCTTQ